jgi:hypothetical protein
LVLIALGAIVKFAPTSVSRVNLATGGVVPMAVGVLGLVVSRVPASTSLRTDVAHHSRGEVYLEQLPNDDPLL